MTAQATAKSAIRADRDLAAAGIGLLVSTTEGAKAAEARLNGAVQLSRGLARVVAAAA